MISRYGGYFPLVVLPAALVLQTAFAANFPGFPREIEEIQITATRVARATGELATALSLLGSEDIIALAPDNLAEALRAGVGTMFQQTTPGQGTPILRGLKGSQVLHLVDGMRLNNAFFRSAPNQYLALVDTFATDRIEVIRGAAGGLYGADAMGGVIHVRTAEPRYDSDTWQHNSRIYGSFDSADDAWVTRLESSSGKWGTSLSGGVSYQDHSDRRGGNGQTIVPSAYRSKAANLKWIQALSPDSELMLSFQFLEQPATPRVDELLPGFGQRTPSSAQYKYSPNKRLFFHTRYTLESSSGWFDRLHLHLAQQVLTDDRLTQEFANPTVINEANESELSGLTLQFDSGFGKFNQLSWGLELYHDEVSSSRTRTDLDNADTVSVQGRFPDGSRMDSAAVYVNSAWRRVTEFELTASLRYSVFEIKMPGSETSPATLLKPHDLTGDIHLVYPVAPNVSLVANIGRGFRPPNIFDLGTLGPRPGNRFNVANTALKPESVWSYDLGMKISSANLQAETFVFYSDYKDKITTVLTGDFTVDGRSIVRSENRNKVRIYGLEAGLRWQLQRKSELYGVLNYTRGEEQDGGGSFPADRIPPVNGKLGLVIALNKLELEPFVLYSGRQDRLSSRDLRDPRINPAGSPGWLTLNLLARWRYQENVELGLRLENLADKHYREHASGIDAPGFNAGIWINYHF